MGVIQIQVEDQDLEMADGKYLIESLYEKDVRQVEFPLTIKKVGEDIVVVDGKGMEVKFVQ
jgi:hypothetical protein